MDIRVFISKSARVTLEDVRSALESVVGISLEEGSGGFSWSPLLDGFDVQAWENRSAGFGVIDAGAVLTFAAESVHEQPAIIARANIARIAAIALSVAKQVNARYWIALHEAITITEIDAAARHAAAYWPASLFSDNSPTFTVEGDIALRVEPGAAFDMAYVFETESEGEM
jgi:hypothetical protein